VSTGEPVPISPIPPGGLLLHIGPPKTGSTAIQNALHARRTQLAEHAVHYAGKGYRPREAGWAVLGMSPSVGRPPVRIEQWERLVRECHEHADDRVCLSNEDFARADDDAAARIVNDLGPDRVHLVHVVRRIDRLLPSTWQERIKAKLPVSYEHWLKVLLAETSDRYEFGNFWRPQGLEGILARWGKLVPAERITLICANDDDHGLLPNTFESLLGLPEGLLTPDPTKSNRGLTANEAELLRRVNRAAWQEKWTPQEYLRFAQLGITRGFRRSAPAPTDQKIPPIPDWALARVAEISEHQVAAIVGSGAHVVGDPQRLVVAPEAESRPAADPVTTVDIDTAVTAVLGAIHGGRKQADWLIEQDRADRAAQVSGARGARVSELSSKELARVIASRVKRRLTRR
jgi:hypothetical protein